MDRVSSEYLTLPNFTSKTPRAQYELMGNLKLELYTRMPQNYEIRVVQSMEYSHFEVMVR